MNKPVTYTTDNCYLTFYNDQDEILCEFYLAEVRLASNNGNLTITDTKTNNSIWLDAEFFTTIGVDIDTFITVIKTARTNSLPALELNLENALTLVSVSSTSTYSIPPMMHQVTIENTGVAEGLVNAVKIAPKSIIKLEGMYVGNQYLTLPAITVDGSGTELSIHMLS